MESLKFDTIFVLFINAFSFLYLQSAGAISGPKITSTGKNHVQDLSMEQASSETSAADPKVSSVMQLNVCYSLAVGSYEAVRS